MHLQALDRPGSPISSEPSSDAGGVFVVGKDLEGLEERVDRFQVPFDGLGPVRSFQELVDSHGGYGERAIRLERFDLLEDFVPPPEQVYAHVGVQQMHLFVLEVDTLSASTPSLPPCPRECFPVFVDLLEGPGDLAEPWSGALG